MTISLKIKKIILYPPLNKLLMCLILDIGIETDFPEQLSALPYKKKRNQKELSQERRNRVQQNSFQKKEHSDRAYNLLQDKKVQDNE